MYNRGLITKAIHSLWTQLKLLNLGPIICQSLSTINRNWRVRASGVLCLTTLLENVTVSIQKPKCLGFQVLYTQKISSINHKSRKHSQHSNVLYSTLNVNKSASRCFLRPYFLLPELSLKVCICIYCTCLDAYRLTKGSLAPAPSVHWSTHYLWTRLVPVNDSWSVRYLVRGVT